MQPSTTSNQPVPHTDPLVGRHERLAIDRWLDQRAGLENQLTESAGAPMDGAVRDEITIAIRQGAR